MLLYTTFRLFNYLGKLVDVSKYLFGCGPSFVFTFFFVCGLSLLPGPTVSSHNHNDKPKFRAKPSIRPTPRSSTLMKPTASQLAKQNNAR